MVCLKSHSYSQKPSIFQWGTKRPRVSVPQTGRRQEAGPQAQEELLLWFLGDLLAAPGHNPNSTHPGLQGRTGVRAPHPLWPYGALQSFPHLLL